eukprot:300981-Amphidinium_carterae.1
MLAEVKDDFTRTVTERSHNTLGHTNKDSNVAILAAMLLVLAPVSLDTTTERDCACLNLPWQGLGPHTKTRMIEECAS